ncbi:MAG: zinc-dependent alcohol dehydrogenase family protein [Pseudomonadota bacterium]
MAKVVKFNEISGVDSLHIVEEDVRDPGAGEVRVAVKTAGLNRAEYLYLHGQYFMPPQLPSLIGVEGAGVIEKVGPGVEGISVGDEVCITPNMQPDAHGVIGELAVVPANAIVPKPANVSWEEAASIWMSYLTAYGGLVEFGGLREGAGQTVVISAASSSVGRPAIQIAKAHGATVIATSRSSAKRDGIMDAGPDHLIATGEEDFVARVQEITGGKGFDIAFDPVSGDFLTTLSEAAGLEATIVEYGALAMAETPFPLFPAIGKGLKVCGFHLVWNLLDFPDRTARATSHISEHLAKGVYNPVVDRVFPLEDVQGAYRYMEQGEQLGKIVVKVAD